MAGVYLSYPFCAQKCTYCNFASGVLPKELEPRYRAALLREIDSHDWKWKPDTIYLGGGTPSLIEPHALAEILKAIPGAPWREATMEAAPGSFNRETIKAWRTAGINRVSLGAQSFVQTELAKTGRKHTAEIVAADVVALRAEGITEINIDLIAGLAGQTHASFEQSLDWVEKLEAPHVSVYMLEVDEDSRLGLEILQGGNRYGAGAIPTAEAITDFYELAVERLARLGIARYEISNFARPGSESLHNLKYWLLHPYIGFGADAHSLDQGRRWQNCDSVPEYVERIASVGSAQTESVDAAPQEERFFVGLRLSEGVEPTPAEWRQFEKPFARFMDAGLLERAGPRIRLTPRGVLLSNEVFEEFVNL